MHYLVFPIMENFVSVGWYSGIAVDLTLVGWLGVMWKVVAVNELCNLTRIYDAPVKILSSYVVQI